MNGAIMKCICDFHCSLVCRRLYIIYQNSFGLGKHHFHFASVESLPDKIMILTR